MPEIILNEDGVPMQVVDEDDESDPLRMQDNPLEVALRGAEAKASEPVKEQEDTAEEGDADGDEEAAEDEELSEEEWTELEGKLDEFIDEEVSARMKPELVGRDRKITKLTEDMEKQKSLIKDLEDKMFEAKISGLSPEEQERYKAVRDLEVRKRELDEYAEATTSLYLSMKAIEFAADYSEFGITVAALEGMSEEEMQAQVNKAELEHYRAVAKGQKPATAAKAAEETKPAPKRAAPAGANAPSDTGGGSTGMTVGEKGKPADGTGMSALAKTLDNLPTETVRIGRH